MKVDNAIIMAAGTSSRFAPLSYETPKALIEVRGEVLIERQIRQLKEVGIEQIIVVTGYKSEQFAYLRDKFGVILINNFDYLHRNNNSSIFVVRDYLRNSYICSSDNYFYINPFSLVEEDESYYSAVFSSGDTDEWCMEEDENGFIRSVKIGGQNSWYMLGHVFWNEEFSKKFLEILEREYLLPETYNKLWETIYIEHIDEFRMRIKKYPKQIIYEFDTLDELRLFDPLYVNDTHSQIIKSICRELKCKEAEIVCIKGIKDSNNEAVGFSFKLKDSNYKYYYATNNMEVISK